MPDSTRSSTPSSTLTVIDIQAEEKDVQTFKALCESRLQLLQQHYFLIKDTLNKAMAISDIWWGAHNSDNTEQKRQYGTKLVDEVIRPYLSKVDALIREHEEKFREDDVIRIYCEFAEEALSGCFNPAPGLSADQALAQKGLAVHLAEIDEIKTLLKIFREHFGRKILLEKAVQGFDIKHLLPSLAQMTDTDSSSWSWLWASSTKDEDKLLWVTFPHAELEEVQRKAFNVVKKERVSLLELKIDYVEDYWHAKMQLGEDEPLLNDNDDKNWAVDFANSTGKRFTSLLDDVKLRLMKDCSLTNFRFLAPLAEKIVFDEHLFVRRLGRCSKEDLYEYAQYRFDRLEADKNHFENLQFRFDNTNANT